MCNLNTVSVDGVVLLCTNRPLIFLNENVSISIDI